MTTTTTTTEAAAEVAHETAKAGMPQLDFSTFPNQIFWLVVTLLVIYFVLSRIALPRIGGGSRARDSKGRYAAAGFLDFPEPDLLARRHAARDLLCPVAHCFAAYRRGSCPACRFDHQRSVGCRRVEAKGHCG